MSLLGEPRENSFMKFEFRHNQALQDLARSLNSVGRIRVSSTYPPLCRAKIEPPVANLQCAIHIETVDYNGNVRMDGGDPLTVNIWDPYGKLYDYDLHDKQSGSYTVIFRPLISGNHKIDIRIFDRPISGSPFLVNVTKHNNPLWSFGKRITRFLFFFGSSLFFKVNVVEVKMNYQCR
jgi:tripartite motif-containing protein 2/3